MCKSRQIQYCKITFHPHWNDLIIVEVEHEIILRQFSFMGTCLFTFPFPFTFPSSSLFFQPSSSLLSLTSSSSILEDSSTTGFPNILYLSTLCYYSPFWVGKCSNLFYPPGSLSALLLQVPGCHCYFVSYAQDMFCQC